MRRVSRSILIFRVGQLGDTVVALPALWAIRQHFPTAHLTYLSDRHPGKSYVVGADLLNGAGLVDDFEFYPVASESSSRLQRRWRMLQLLVRLRRRRFDTVVYLLPSLRQPHQVERDRRFFALAGVHHFIGMDGFAEMPVKVPGQPLAEVSHEADQLLRRLAASGIPVPPAGHGCMHLNLGGSEARSVAAWRETLPGDGGRPWIGIGPGTKMPAKQWSSERFGLVVAELIERFDVWPVIFGGTEDRETGDRLIADWRRGYNAAGQLGLRPAAAALQQCRLYLGNDTGTMHLAAAVGVSCVAVFSARDWPGKWNPYGARHQVLRAQVECEGCALTHCVERGNRCLSEISVGATVSACAEVLERFNTLQEHPDTYLRAS